MLTIENIPLKLTDYISSVVGVVSIVFPPVLAVLLSIVLSGPKVKVRGRRSGVWRTD